MFPIQSLFNAHAEGLPFGVGNTGRAQETGTIMVPGQEKV